MGRQLEHVTLGSELAFAIKMKGASEGCQVAAADQAS